MYVHILYVYKNPNIAWSREVLKPRDSDGSKIKLMI